MTGNIGSFRRGATAFRNAREMARQKRETFIHAANTRASQAGLVADVEYSAHLHGNNDLHHGTGHSETTPWQDSHDDLQQHIAESCVADCEATDKGSATPHYLYSSDES